MIKIAALVLILVLSIPIFNFTIYSTLINFMDREWAYVIDQFLPLIFSSLLAYFAIRNHISSKILKRYLLENWKPITAIILICVGVHGWTLGNFFLGEGRGFINFVNEPSLPQFREYSVGVDPSLGPVSGIFKTIHYGAMILEYKLFWNRAEFYNATNLLMYSFTAVVLFTFLKILLSRRSAPAFVGTMFFITTPAYLDTFARTGELAGISIALSAGIFSLLFLILWQKKSRTSYYILSLLFYLSAIKISFLRLHPFIALPLFLLLFPNMRSRFKGLDIKKLIIYGAPFLSIFLIYLLTIFVLPDHIVEKLFPVLFKESSYAHQPIVVHGYKILVGNYLPTLSALVAYLFLPSQFAEVYYPQIKNLFGLESHISLTLIFGIFTLLILGITSLIASINIRKSWGRLMLFSLVIIFTHILLTPFSYASLSFDLKELDWRFSQTGSNLGPGSRYVFVSAMGLSLLVAVITCVISERFKKYLSIFLVFMFALFSYYSYLDISNHLYYVEKESNPRRILADHVFELVPRNNESKLLYSTNPAKNTIDSTIPDGASSWLYTFYKVRELKYINSYDEARQKIDSRKYTRENFYAFYTNPKTNTYKEISDFAWKELVDSTPTQKPIELSKKYNNSLPFLHNTDVIASEELNIRILAPSNFSVSIRDNPTPVNHLYLAYACAEDDDWGKQVNSTDVVPGIWFAKEITLNKYNNNKPTLSITCNGSILRKITFLSQPLPNQIIVESSK